MLTSVRDEENQDEQEMQDNSCTHEVTKADKTSIERAALTNNTAVVNARKHKSGYIQSLVRSASRRCVVSIKGVICRWRYREHFLPQEPAESNLHYP